MTRILGVLIASLGLSGCATLVTLDPEGDAVQVDKYQGRSSYCYEIPRVYSGLSYHACSHPIFVARRQDPDFPEVEYYPLGLVHWDTALSFVADTLVLPYTIYMQMTRGNLKVDGKDLIVNLKESIEKGIDEGMLTPPFNPHTQDTVSDIDSIKTDIED